MNEFTWVFLIALILMTGIELWLSLRQGRHVLAHRDKIPEAFKDEISLDAHHKAADYTQAKGKFGRVEGLFGMVLLLAWTLGGGLGLLSDAWQSLALPTPVTSIIFILSFFIINFLFSSIFLLELIIKYFLLLVLD